MVIREKNGDDRASIFGGGGNDNGSSRVSNGDSIKSRSHRATSLLLTDVPNSVL